MVNMSIKWTFVQAMGIRSYVKTFSQISIRYCCYIYELKSFLET